MNVRVRLGAGLTPTVGNSRLLVTLSENATVAELLDQLRAQHPTLASKINSAIPMIAGHPATLSERLTDAQEVALLLPAAGGY